VRAPSRSSSPPPRKRAAWASCRPASSARLRSVIGRSRWPGFRAPRSGVASMAWHTQLCQPGDRRLDDFAFPCQRGPRPSRPASRHRAPRRARRLVAAIREKFPPSNSPRGPSEELAIGRVRECQRGIGQEAADEGDLAFDHVPIQRLSLPEGRFVLRRSVRCRRPNPM
jgi:hypothetical protein